jgi:clan AA aspartic protease
VITGVVNAHHEATIVLSVRDAGGQQSREILAILDTGVSGSLTLPSSLIAALALPFRTRGSALLADGSQTYSDIHAASILWDGNPRNVLVEAAETEPLVGMGLLYGHEIRIQAIDGGRVTIEPLPG